MRAAITRAPWRRLAWLLLAVGLDARAAAPEIGRQAPDLLVQRLDGRSFDLKTQRGHVVLVNVWATWCGPCRSEMPALNSFYAQHHAAGLELLGLSIDDPRDAAAVRSVMRQFGYPAALASGARTNGFGEPFAVPITYVIDRSGVLRARLLPKGSKGISRQELEQAVLPLLHAPTQPGA